MGIFPYDRGETVTISFSVPGIPQPRGSKRAMPNRAGGRPLMVDTNPKSKPWMATVAAAAAEAMNGRELMHEAVELRAHFNFPRPKSHYRTGKHSHELRPDAPAMKFSKPDCSKLVRAIEDAMTGVVYRDDAQIAVIDITKRYCEGAGFVAISVSEID